MKRCRIKRTLCCKFVAILTISAISSFSASAVCLDESDLSAQLPANILSIPVIFAILFASLLFSLAIFIYLYINTHKTKVELEKLIEEHKHEFSFQNATLSALMDSIPDLVFFKDLEFRYTLCNKSFLRFFNLLSGDIIGKEDLHGLNLPADKLEEVRERDQMVINKKRAFTFEEYIPDIYGVDILFETVKAPIFIKDTIVGIVGVAHEITKYKKLEDEALAALRAKSMFLTYMSHEIRTPMNSIIGFTELAQHSPNPPETTEYLGKILESSQWLLNVISDIIDVSMIETGRIELRSIPFSLPDLFTYCLAIVFPKAKEKRLKLHSYIEPSLKRRLLGDQKRLRQIIINLLSHSITFTNAGTVCLNATIKAIYSNHISVHFEVKDSGIGLSPEQISQVFEPLIEGEGSISRKFGGTGLGLAICKSVVELMGGELCLESSPGIGSKFSFDLTFYFFDDSYIAANDINSDDFIEPGFSAEVLVCEDIDFHREVIYDHLTKAGIKTTIANNGKEGVDIISKRQRMGEKPFDLIFMDIQMPVMDGLDASSKIIKMGVETPIVALTANVMENDLKVYMSSGLSDYLSKPYTKQELQQCLLKYLSVEK